MDGEKRNDDDDAPDRAHGIPRTIPLTPVHTTRTPLPSASAATPTYFAAASPAASTSARPRTPTSPSPWVGTSGSPLRPTMTGTRYGAGLLGSPTKATFNSTSMGTSDVRGAGPGSPSSLPLRPAATGTRYGAGLLGSPTKGMSTPSSPLGSGTGIGGGGTPLCAKCMKPVFFAEQVKASGRTFHRPCLRCTDCNTALDSSRLAEKGDRIVCRNCYSKVGPCSCLVMLHVTNDPVCLSVELRTTGQWICITRKGWCLKKDGCALGLHAYASTVVCGRCGHRTPLYFSHEITCFIL